jgi:hypothetical protein
VPRGRKLRVLPETLAATVPEAPTFQRSAMPTKAVVGHRAPSAKGAPPVLYLVLLLSVMLGAVAVVLVWMALRR